MGNNFHIMNNSTHVAKEFYRKLGAKGLEELAREWRVSDDVKIVRKLLRKGDKVLDAGCGYGRVAMPLARAGFDITGIDISRVLIQNARRRKKREEVSARFDIGNMVKLPYNNDSFDKIVSLWNTFNELLTKKEQIKALDEIFRVLRPGGMAFIVVRNGEQKEVRRELKERGLGSDGRLLRSELMGIESISYIHDRSTLRRLCRKSKFKRWKIQFKNMNARRRLVLYLYK